MLMNTMASLCVLKLVATITSYASGNAGGIFAPSLYIGAMAGGTVGMLVHTYAPFPTADPGAYALVGMGTLFAGIIRAPMTSVFMIFEITQDYQILVPLMVANMLSFAISKRYQQVPVYHALLHQDGVHLPAPGSAAPSRKSAARPLMRTEFMWIPPEASINAALKLVQAQDAPAYLVGTHDSLKGAVERQALIDAAAAGQGREPVTSLMTPSLPHAHPDHATDIVLERFAQSPGVLPVVSRADARRALGVVTLDSIMEFVGRRPQTPRRSECPVDCRSRRRRREQRCPACSSTHVIRLRLRRKGSAMKTLVAIKDAGCAAAVTRIVLEQVRRDDATLRLLTVVEPYPVAQAEAEGDREHPDFPKARLRQREQAAMLLASAAAVLESAGFSRPTLAVAEGDPCSEILTEAKQWGADVIMVGTDGGTNLLKRLVGGVSTTIARHASCTVEIVRIA